MTEFVHTIVIDSRFSGPPGLGNGGYVCGVVARAVGSEATVTLRAPIPLDTGLELAGTDGGGGGGPPAADRPPGVRRVVLRDGGTLLAEGMPGAPGLPVPPPAPDRATAAAASERYSGRTPNPYQECFVCGFAREPGQALRVFAGPTPTPGLVAADWPVHPDLAGEDGTLPEEYLWGALDCPGAYAAGVADLRLGRMAARISRRVRSGERCTVVGWHLGRERRKHFTGTAVHDEGGDVVALAFSIWIAPRETGPDS